MTDATLEFHSKLNWFCFFFSLQSFKWKENRVLMKQFSWPFSIVSIFSEINLFFETKGFAKKAKIMKLWNLKKKMTIGYLKKHVFFCIGHDTTAFDQLQLTLLWDRVELAREKVLSRKCEWTVSNYLMNNFTLDNILFSLG